MLRLELWDSELFPRPLRRVYFGASAHLEVQDPVEAAVHVQGLAQVHPLHLPPRALLGRATPSCLPNPTGRSAPNHPQPSPIEGGRNCASESGSSILESLRRTHWLTTIFPRALLSRGLRTAPWVISSTPFAPS